jgi:hypothetical protein
MWTIVKTTTCFGQLYVHHQGVWSVLDWNCLLLSLLLIGCFCCVGSCIWFVWRCLASVLRVGLVGFCSVDVVQWNAEGWLSTEYSLYLSTLCVWVLFVFEYSVFEYALCLSTLCVWVPFGSTLCVWVLFVFEYALCLSTLCVWVRFVFEYSLCLSTLCVWVRFVFEYALCLSTFCVWVLFVFEYSLCLSTLCVWVRLEF